MNIVDKFLSPFSRSRDAGKTAGTHPYQAVADLAGSLRSYQEMPIHIQREGLAMFVAGVMLLGLVAGMYLNVTASAAIAGREIQILETEIVVNQRINADLQTKIAGLLSSQRLAERARAAGYESVTRDNLEYMVVPGYFPATGLNLIPPVAEPARPALLPEYSESLLDWVSRQLDSASKPLQ